jgi:glycosyltransferase involved in cell wall biosynthesis
MRTAKSISFTTPVYNEIENIEECIDRVIQLHKEYFSELELEHIIIDNYSTDGTREYLDDVSNKHSHLKIIFNLGNFGLSNSPHFALLKTTGDIVIPIVADLQTPLEIVPEMYNIWKNGTDVVIAQRLRSASSGWRKVTQKYYYDFLQKLSDEEVIPNFIGFGLYDKRIIDLVKNQNDPAPYFRGFIQNIDPSRKVVTYVEKPRKAGKSKQNFRDKLELALLGITY